MSAQVANILASPDQFKIKNYDIDTYPRFSTQFKDAYLSQTRLKLYLVWNTLPTFVFNDAESECETCEYRTP